MKREQFIPEEALGAEKSEEIKGNKGDSAEWEEEVEVAPEPKSAKGLWRKIKNAGERVAFVATLIASLEKGIAAEEPEKPLSEKEIRNRITLRVDETRESQKVIYDEIERVGGKGIMNINEPMVVRKSVLSDESEVRVLYEQNEDKSEKPTHVIYSTGGGGKIFIDYNANGTIDRIIYNNTSTDQKNKTERERAIKDVTVFSSINGLALLAKSGLKPEDTQVYEFKQENNGSYTMSGVDFKSGERIEGTGSDKSVLVAQEKFGEVMKKAKTELSKVQPLKYMDRKPPYQKIVPPWKT